MNSNFNLLNKCYSYNEYYVDILINFPKKDVFLKQSIEKGFYDLIEYLFAFNINTSDRIKQKYLKDFLVKLSMLDYYTKIGFHKKIITKRQFEVLGRKCIEIRKMTYGLIKKSENDE